MTAMVAWTVKITIAVVTSPCAAIRTTTIVTVCRTVRIQTVMERRSVAPPANAIQQVPAMKRHQAARVSATGIVSRVRVTMDFRRTAQWMEMVINAIATRVAKSPCANAM